MFQYWSHPVTSLGNPGQKSTDSAMARAWPPDRSPRKHLARNAPKMYTCIYAAVRPGFPQKLNMKEKVTRGGVTCLYPRIEQSQELLANISLTVTDSVLYCSPSP